MRQRKSGILKRKVNDKLCVRRDISERFEEALMNE